MIRRLTISLFFAVILTSKLSYAGSVLVAVASNFTAPMQDIAEAFEKQTQHTTTLAFGSSGKFYNQIKNGAPFDIFLSADQSKPKQLEIEALCVKDTRFTYAFGRLALYSSARQNFNAPKVILQNRSTKHIAIANPKLAPYGRAAMEVLKNLGLDTQLASQLVIGENIAQAFQFVVTGNAELGFIALAQIKEPHQNSIWVVPENLHSPIKQDAVLLLKGQDNLAAKDLLKFLKSKTAQDIMTKYGYTFLQTQLGNNNEQR